MDKRYLIAKDLSQEKEVEDNSHTIRLVIGDLTIGFDYFELPIKEVSKEEVDYLDILNNLYDAKANGISDKEVACAHWYVASCVGRCKKGTIEKYRETFEKLSPHFSKKCDHAIDKWVKYKTAHPPLSQHEIYSAKILGLD